MFHNYYFLKPLSKALAEKLQVNWQLGLDEQEFVLNHGSPMRLGECFSQNKDELVLGFCNQDEDFYIRAWLSAEFGSLSFPNEYPRAKKNSVDLLKELIDLQVVTVIQHLNERSFSLIFENDFTLLFKMHGKRANIVLFEKEEFCIAFHKKMTADYEIKITDLDRKIEQTAANFASNEYDWKKLFPTFGKEVNEYLTSQNIQNLSPENQWNLLEKTLQILENPTFSVINPDSNPDLTLLPPTPAQKIYTQTQDPILAANEYVFSYTRHTFLAQEKQNALREIQKRLKQAQAYVEKNFTRLAEISDSSQNEQIANLIMANLHQIPAGVSQYEVIDFYTEQPRVIKLKKEISPQKNAENYYRKAKNEKIEKETLETNLARKEQEINKLQENIIQIEKIENLKDLRKYLRENQLIKEEKSRKPDQFLFKKFAFAGFEIWVGKNAKNNDLLTTQYAYKEDLWLHAKDVSGSHVVIKYQAGKPFPKDVIAKAAALAAYYSKRSNDSLCPVIYTPKKFVRKTRDLADGQVIVEKEEVIMVVPEKN
jgi:predicted ribosome quality control (RQC) complex YloA/Tae2 family protein